ncbi:hypothetical protein Xmau_03316 [Xenorhabdus mauleonii]|uniref:Uncharacterized protein n=1 Tax=Xenorhabdus mauleonii TaxID=351675 RepID=A0A1I3WEK1_9GAMM|nr:hypothetical protein [Xenorhabdus mauleonii]PHM38937.1 hypothetical protein Xmau_03316 [Xenorhabdus mauleonii]SFK05968.1 hypothetical protein SAMN05421680_12613 [Xenorhabdus mauleonii]
MDILDEIVMKIFEIFYNIIKYTIKILAWMFRVAISNIAVSLLSIAILFFLLFSLTISRFILNTLFLAMLGFLFYKNRKKIKNFLNKKGIMDYFK